MCGDFLMMVDHQIGRVLGALGSATILDNSLLVSTSDNGPVWHPENISRLGHNSGGGLRGDPEAGARLPVAMPSGHYVIR